tara:strand:+ start:5882 stop:6088 length:207 start_codon:yes stop_codon:yes gene_type:complete
LTKETSEERKARYKSMSSSERIELIRSKMKTLGLKEGSGVPNATYDSDEIWDLILVASCLKDLNINDF